MAQGLRSRREREEVAARRARAAAGLLALTFSAACGRDAPQPTPDPAPKGARPVDVAALDASTLPQAILDECHRPLRDRMSRVKVRLSIGTDRELLVQAALPGRARVREGKVDWLVRDDAVQRLDGATVDEGEARLMRSVLQVVDAAAFGPVHRSTSCTRDGDVFALQAPDGASSMALFSGTLLPRSFARDGVTVTIEDYLHTKVSWVARTLRHPHLGVCRAIFEDGGVQFPPGYFAPPGEGANPSSSKPQIRTPIPGAVVETQSPTPIVVDGKATQLVVLPDPGDWQGRHEAYRPVIEELQAQNQRIAGFPCIFVDEASRGLLAAPFRRRKDGDAFDAPDGYWLSDVPKGRVLVVYPPDGDIPTRIEAGRKLLERALANRKLTARGPILAQPFVHLHKGPPDEAKLQSATVRVWVRIE